MHSKISGIAHSHTHRTGNLKIAFVLNLVFSIIEIAGGIYTNSVAILADALHDLGDSASLGMAWYLEKVATKKRDHKFSYGYGRFSLLAAFLNGLILITGSTIILFEAIPRIANPEEVNTPGMILMAILGVAFNGLAAVRLSKGESMNEKMVFWHIIEDVFGWVAVLIGGVIMYFFDIPVIDPLISVAFTLFILFQVIKNLKKVFKIFMQGMPTGINTEEIEKEITSIEGVESAHDIHVWSLDGSRNILTVHVRVINSNTLDTIALKKEIRTRIKDFDVEHVTIELESIGEDCEYEDC